jgi:hypothetical protein
MLLLLVVLLDLLALPVALLLGFMQVLLLLLDVCANVLLLLLVLPQLVAIAFAPLLLLAAGDDGVSSFAGRRRDWVLRCRLGVEAPLLGAPAVAIGVASAIGLFRLVPRHRLSAAAALNLDLVNLGEGSRTDNDLDLALLGYDRHDLRPRRSPTASALD